MVEEQFTEKAFLPRGGPSVRRWSWKYTKQSGSSKDTSWAEFPRRSLVAGVILEMSI
jgi:hypothetical protein